MFHCHIQRQAKGGKLPNFSTGISKDRYFPKLSPRIPEYECFPKSSSRIPKCRCFPCFPCFPCLFPKMRHVLQIGGRSLSSVRAFRAKFLQHNISPFLYFPGSFHRGLVQNLVCIWEVAACRGSRHSWLGDSHRICSWISVPPCCGSLWTSWLNLPR